LELFVPFPAEVVRCNCGSGLDEEPSGGKGASAWVQIRLVDAECWKYLVRLSRQFAAIDERMNCLNLPTYYFFPAQAPTRFAEFVRNGLPVPHAIYSVFLRSNTATTQWYQRRRSDTCNCHYRCSLQHGICSTAG